MPKWSLQEADLKKYPHFDPLISAAEAETYASDPKLVAEHSFYPFMRYVDRWNRFAKDGEKREPKERPIRYAARRDAYIFSYYRHLLSEKYEAELSRLGLADCVLAYRRIADDLGKGGKCNIHFARDAVLKIQELGNCCAVALDISGFFESLDHERLKAIWCRLLGVPRLPQDHFRVFEAITKYAVVDKEAVYERLGHFGVKRKAKNGRPIKGYITPYKDIPKQLCTGSQFREKLGDGAPQGSIIKKNFKPYGIPQGAPISDLLANLYLLDFDLLVAKKVKAMGGAYYRYSDDILLVVPGGKAAGCEIETWARAQIRNFGPKLKIKEEKSSVFEFVVAGGRQVCSLVKGTKGRNGLEYLGFRYDGRKVYIRNGTLSNLYRKITRSARREANALARRYPNRSASELRKSFDYERLIRRFGRVENFDHLKDNYEKWTFWTYSKRAAQVFGDIGRPISRQLRRHRSVIKAKADKEIERAVSRR